MTKSAPSPCNYLSLTAELFCWWRLKLYTVRYIPYMEGYIGFFLFQKQISQHYFSTVYTLSYLRVGIRHNMGRKENDQKPFFERIKSRIPPKNCHLLAKFGPKFRQIQIPMPTMSTKLHHWLKN